MKTIKTLFTVLMTFAAIGCGKMTLPKPVPSDYYFKAYGCYFNDYFTSVKVTSERELYISGYTITEEDSSYAYLCKADRNGMRVWDTTFDTPFTKAHEVVFVESSKQIYTVLSQQVSDDTALVSLLKMETSGEVKKTWSAKVKASAINSMRLLYHENTQIRIFSQIDIINKTNPEDISNFIVVHDFVENKLKKVNQRNVDQRITGSISLIEGNNNNSYLTLTVFESKAQKFTDICLLCYEDLAVKWDKPFGTPGINETASDILKTENGLAISGNYKNSPDSRQKIIVYYSDMDGEEQDSIIIGIDNFDTDITTTSFCLNNFGNFVFTGYQYTGERKSDIFFLETTPDGENLKSNSFGSHGDKIGENKGKSILYHAETDSYVIGGNLEPITNTDICVFSLDKEGEWITR